MAEDRDWGVRSSRRGGVGRRGHRILKWDYLMYLLNRDPITISKHSARRRCGDSFYSCIFLVAVSLKPK